MEVEIDIEKTDDSHPLDESGWTSKGGIVSSICLIVSISLGVGFTTLHTIGSKNGMLSLILAIVLGWVIIFSSNMMVSYASLSVNFRTFVEMTEMSGGGWVTTICNYFIIIVLIIGNAQSYLFETQFIASLAGYFGYDMISDSSIQVQCILILYVVGFCGSLIKSISSLRYIGIFSSISSLLLATVILLQAKPVHDSLRSQINTFHYDSQLFGQLILAVFSLSNQVSAVHVIKELRNPTKSRLFFVMKVSHIIVLVFVLGVAVAGYYTCGQVCPDTILNRRAPPGSTDRLFVALKLVFIPCFTLYTMIREYSIRQAIYFMVTGRDSNASYKNLEEKNVREPKTLTAKEFFIGLFSSWISLGLAVFCKSDILSFTKLAFGFVAPFTAVILPCMVMIRFYNQKKISLTVRCYFLIKAYMIFTSSLLFFCLATMWLSTLKII